MEVNFFQFSFLFSFVLLTLLLLGFFKKTPFEFSFNGNSVWSFLFYKELVFILLPIFVLMFLDVSRFNSLRMTEQSSVFQTSVIITLSLFFFFLSLFLFYKVFFGKINQFDCNFNPVIKDIEKNYIFSISFLLSGLTILFFSMISLGYKHAFLSSIFSGDNLLHVRLANTYTSHLPSQLSYVITMSWWISSIFSGYLFYRRKRFFSILFFISGLFLATAHGSKAPAIQFAVMFLMSCFFFYSPRITLSKSFIYYPIYFFIFCLLVFYVVSLQIEDLDLELFLSYLLERLGVGQMSGTYETLSLEFSVPGSWWHMVPFASFFVDYPIFSKELMLYTEGAAYDATGVKNSFFISEAFGMGGWGLLVLSPFIMAFSLLLKMLLISKALRVLFGMYVEKVYMLPILFLSTSLTGDLSSMILQKGTILVVMVIFFVYLISYLVRPFFQVRNF